MRKLLTLTTILASAILYFSCQKEVSFSDNESIKISEAKIWFEKYHANNKIDPIFKNINYHWEKASIFTFINGYKVITVPITEIKQNPTYRGRRILYLYPWKNRKGYYATVFELLPEFNHTQNNKGQIDLKTFSGLISTWDLKLGFIRGAYFTNGNPENNIQIAYSKQKGSNGGTNASNSPILSSPNIDNSIRVTGAQPAANYGWYWITLMNNLGYSTSYLWNGGSGGNPCEYTSCGNSDPYAYFDPSTINDITTDLDQQWLDNSVKDSTLNNCVNIVLTSLASINDKLPALMRGYFNSSPNFHMTLKMYTNSSWGSNSQAPEGGYTALNTTSNNFNVFLNGYYTYITDLGTACTIIHEALHCQLMNWYREVTTGDTARRNQLARDYGYIFPPDYSADSSLIAIVNGGTTAEHQDIINRFQNAVAEALFQFAQSRGISVTLDYCKDLAWTGTFDSKAFLDLSYTVQERIRDRVLAEKDPHSLLSDPTGTYTVNANQITPKGTACY